MVASSSVTRGAAAPQSCVNGCYYFVVNWQNMDAGPRGVDCYNGALGGGGAGDGFNNYRATIDFTGNGSAQLECRLGADGYDVWVDIIGWGGGADTEKTWWPRG